MDLSKAKTLLLLVVGSSLVCTSAFADYYKPNFFPIGLTGLNYSGWTCPYYSKEWRWQYEDGKAGSEDSLVYNLGVNCIGCEDVYRHYLVSFDPETEDEDTYLHKVCLPSLEDDDTTNNVYLISATYWALPRFKWIDPESSTCDDPHEVDSVRTVARDILASNMFRSYYYTGGFGSWRLNPAPKEGLLRWDEVPWCCGPKTDNWDACDGDDSWHEMVDDAVANFKAYFQKHSSDKVRECIWGYNLISEDPACARRMSMGKWNGTNDHWHGCWAGVDYIFTGHKGTSAFIGDFPPADSHDGVRGVEKALNMDHRMIIAKFNPACLHKMGYNIFQWLPDIDAIVVFRHRWCSAQFNYGEQGLFDNFLYGTVAKEKSPLYADKCGFHNHAIYMQRYSNSFPAYPDQERRWIPYLALEWIAWGTSANQCDLAEVRRPCPPEIRCAAYLLMSRGAKGILFHGWSFGTKYTWIEGSDTIPDVDVPIPSVKIPNDYNGRDYNVGIRDRTGYPFGYDGAPYLSQHKLNNGPDTEANRTYWHNNPKDTTYYYLCTLIPELKKITSKLMELDWVNAYSLNSIAPDWRSPCPHYYVDDVWGCDFMDLAFFDHPYEPVGVEYFMMVNREGIADMTNRTVSVALDADHWPEEDTLILTDIANPDNPRRLKRVGERFTFTEVFEPGEGKLYRVAPTNEASITLVPSTEGGVR